jgi:hypothetical protein
MAKTLSAPASPLYSATALPTLDPEATKTGTRSSRVGSLDHVTVFQSPAALVEYCRDLSWENTPAYHWLYGWSGDDMSREKAFPLLENGDLAGVSASDKYLSQLEDMARMETYGHATVNSLAGGVPNIPAVLAGHPLNMRLRKRISRAQAPLTIIVDLSSSATVDTEKLTRRGAAILALVRALSEVRPVTLYAGCVVGSPESKKRDYCGAFVRIETAPLDLARAAHMLTHISISRGFFYNVLRRLHQYTGSYLGWAFGAAGAEKLVSQRILARAFGNEEILYVPPVFQNDAMFSAPETWVRDQIKSYGLPPAD